MYGGNCLNILEHLNSKSMTNTNYIFCYAIYYGIEKLHTLKVRNFSINLYFLENWSKVNIFYKNRSEFDLFMKKSVNRNQDFKVSGYSSQMFPSQASSRTKILMWWTRCRVLSPLESRLRKPTHRCRRTHLDVARYVCSAPALQTMA